MTAEQLALIVSDPNVLHGQVCLEGTRIPVSVVLDCLAAGMTEADILRDYRRRPSRPFERPLPMVRP